MKIKVGEDVYDYDPAALTLREVRRLNEQGAGLQITDLLRPSFNDPRILTAIIWLCRTRDGEVKLRYEDVDVPLAEIQLDMDLPADDDSPTQATLEDDAQGSPISLSESSSSSVIPASGS